MYLCKENLKSKSLTTFVQSNPTLHGLRFSLSDYRVQDLLTNIPLYAATSYMRDQMKRRQEEIDRLIGNLI